MINNTQKNKPLTANELQLLIDRTKKNEKGFTTILTSQKAIEKETNFKAIEIILKDNLTGAIDAVSHFASMNLTRNQNTSLFRQILNQNLKIGLLFFNKFNIPNCTKKEILLESVETILNNKYIDLAKKISEISSKILNKKQHNLIQLKLNSMCKDENSEVIFQNTKKTKSVKKHPSIDTQFPQECFVNSLFSDKIKKLKKGGRIKNDKPIFGSIDEKNIDREKLQWLISLHAQKKQHLFFHLLVLYYKTGVMLELGDTYFQYGKGKNEPSPTHAAHSSIITGLKVKTQSEQTFWDITSFYDLYLAHSCNGTIVLPEKANEIDSKIEGKNHSEVKKLRHNALEILQEASDGKICPQIGMNRFLEATNIECLNILKTATLSEDQLGYLAAEIQGSNQIKDRAKKISGNFFRWNLALSFPENEEIHGLLANNNWEDLTSEKIEELFLLAQQETRNQKAIVRNTKAVED